ncbi:MAG: beta-eliminating lyase-related protein [Pseudomonadota bacterium]
MDFSSDTSAPAHPAVIDALARANGGQAASYGADGESQALAAQLADLFETREIAIWPTASGTAANALALSCFCPPTHTILCHRDAHIECDERGAPEFFTGGGKLALLEGAGGKISEDALDAALASVDPGFVHAAPPAALSLTNLTEWGTAYTGEETAARAAKAKALELTVHLDGARLGNALAALGAAPADLTWRAGVDLVTLGLTKTGAMGCDIIVLFGAAAKAVGDLHARAKRSGHMPPKARFLAAQARALLEGGLWLELAAHANAMAARLADGIFALPGAAPLAETQGNEVFASLPGATAEAMRRAGWSFYPWPGGGYRFVCSWATQPGDVDQALAALARA